MIGCQLLTAALLLSQEWPQWRGPNRDGVVPAAQVPSTWPKDLKSKWRVSAGSGYASPVVSQGAILLFSRDGENEVLSRFTLATGKLEWSKSYAVSFQKNSYAKDMSKGPFSTPLLRDGRIYTLGVTAILSAWDAKSGALLWRNDYSSTVDTSKLFTGTAMSPVFAGSHLIVHTGDDRGSVVQALNPLTGRPNWTLRMTAGPGYASPIVLDNQWISMTSESVASVEIATGKLLWTFPWKDEWLENIVTPVRVPQLDLVVFSGVRRGTVALRIPKSGPPVQVWANPDAAFYMSTPVADGTYLYGLGSRKKGQYLCLDGKTGKTLWSTTGREANQAAVQSAGDHIVWLTNDGDLLVSRKSPKSFEMVSRYSVSDAPVWSQPVLLGRQILVKSDNALSLWSLD